MRWLRWDLCGFGMLDYSEMLLRIQTYNVLPLRSGPMMSQR